MGSDARRYRVAASLVAWFAVLLQTYVTVAATIAHGGTALGGVVVLLGYFTVLTNILVCISLTAPWAAPRSSAALMAMQPTLAAGLAVSISFVMIAYHFLLRHLWHPQGASWVADTLLHYVVPALYVMFWFVYSRDGVLRVIHPVLWAGYPLAYFLYAIARGEIIHQYPYAFIDVSVIGYRHTWINALGLLVAFIALGELFVGIDRLRRRVPAPESA